MVSLREVKIAWAKFNSLPTAHKGASPPHYKAREDAFKEYARLRDIYLRSIQGWYLPYEVSYQELKKY